MSVSSSFGYEYVCVCVRACARTRAHMLILSKQLCFLSSLVPFHCHFSGGAWAPFRVQISRRQIIFIDLFLPQLPKSLHHAEPSYNVGATI